MQKAASTQGICVYKTYVSTGATGEPPPELYVKRWIMPWIIIHEQTKSPLFQHWVKWVHRNLSENHCKECLRLDGCWFQSANLPEWPHHPHCHCILEPVSYSEVVGNAASISEYSKYDPYLFDPERSYLHGKNRAFERWGYSVADSKWLQAEIEKQGLEKYKNGEYTLGLLNKYGQRISIRVTIPRKNRNEMVSFITGWMVRPNGTIELNTPFGGK